MALHRCPECRKKISESATLCPQLTRQNEKIQLFWLAVFALVIGFAAWWKN